MIADLLVFQHILFLFAMARSVFIFSSYFARVFSSIVMSVYILPVSVLPVVALFKGNMRFCKLFQLFFARDHAV